MDHKNTLREFTPEEEKIATQPGGFYGLTGRKAVLAYRGTCSGATTTEKVAHAIALVQQEEPGYRITALNALEDALAELDKP